MNVSVPGATGLAGVRPAGFGQPGPRGPSASPKPGLLARKAGLWLPQNAIQETHRGAASLTVYTEGLGGGHGRLCGGCAQVRGGILREGEAARNLWLRQPFPD